MRSIAEFLIESIYPERGWVRSLENCDAATFMRLVGESPPLSRMDMAACIAYRHPLSEKMLWHMKFQKHRRFIELCADILNEKILDLKAHRGIFEPFVLTSIPVHKARIRTLGFNHIELVLKKLHERHDVPILLDMLAYKKEMKAQKHFKRSERLLRMENVFAVVPDKIDELPRTTLIVIVDDIVTTGATCGSAMDCLCEAGHPLSFTLAIAH